MDKFNYGENLRRIRLQKGISQEAMAHHLKISQKTYSRMEHHVPIPHIDQVHKTAKVLGVEPAELLPYVAAPDQQAIHSAYESVMGHKAKAVLLSPFGTIIVLGCACALLPATYELTESLCIEFKAPDYTTAYAPRVAVLAMGIYIWYGVKRIKRLG